MDLSHIFIHPVIITQPDRKPDMKFPQSINRPIKTDRLYETWLNTIGGNAAIPRDV